MHVVGKWERRAIQRGKERKSFCLLASVAAGRGSGGGGSCARGVRAFDDVMARINRDRSFDA